jgi:hypothetical protein
MAPQELFAPATMRRKEKNIVLPVLIRKIIGLLVGILRQGMVGFGYGILIGILIKLTKPTNIIRYLQV